MRYSKTHLEGGLIVEMQDGSHRHILMSPHNKEVRHSKAGDAFGEVELTPEDEFRSQIRRVVSRSRYDSR